MGDDIGHCEGFAGACDAHEGLESAILSQAVGEFFDSLRLVARRLKLVVQLEYGHWV